jgi:hypothetical protein
MERSPKAFAEHCSVRWKTLLAVLWLALPCRLQAAPGDAAGLPVTFSPSSDLTRLQLAPQIGILKVLSPDRLGVAYSRGFDDYHMAPIDDSTRASILQALGLTPNRLAWATHDIISNFPNMPRREGVAFLGLALSYPKLDTSTQDRAEKFLVQVLQADKDVVVRRQALLALALKPKVSARTTESVIQLYEHSDNLWETFPVQQFFEYHAAQVRALSNYPQLRQRLAAVNSLYTPALLQSLDQP